MFDTALAMEEIVSFFKSPRAAFSNLAENLEFNLGALEFGINMVFFVDIKLSCAPIVILSIFKSKKYCEYSLIPSTFFIPFKTSTNRSIVIHVNSGPFLLSMSKSLSALYLIICLFLPLKI